MKRTLFLLSVLAVNFYAQGQNRPLYSLYRMNNYVINPAVTGLQNFGDVRLGYRNQWSGIDGSPKTYYLSLHSPVGKEYLRLSREVSDQKINGPSFGKFKGTNGDNNEIYPHHGIGGFVVGDKAGAFQRVQGNVSYAYHLRIAEKLGLSAGTSVGFTQHSIDFSQVNFAQPDIVSGADKEKAKGLDIGFGLWLYSNDFYLGISAFKLFDKSFNANAAEIKNYNELLLLLTGSYDININTDFALVPSFLVRHSADSPVSLDGTVFLEYKERFGLGATYRHDNFIVPMFRMAITRFMVLGYAYDFATSDPNGIKDGSHEITMGIKL